MRIAAIIPLYNGAAFIEEAIVSVAQQTRKADELIVVDDGSSDDGPEIVERLSKTYPLTLLRKENGGQGSARNYGVRHCSSELIALLDQDDAWYPHHLAELERPFLQSPRKQLGYAYSDLDRIDRDNRCITPRFLDDLSKQHPAIEHPKRTQIACLAYNMYVVPGATLIARAAFEAVGGFDANFIGYEDDDLFYRLFLAGFEGEFLDMPLTKWRIYPESTSNTPKMALSRLRYFKKHGTPDKVLGDVAANILVPRFLPDVMSDVMRAALHGKQELAPICADTLQEFLPHISDARKRHLIRLLIVILRSPLLLALANSPVAKNPLGRRMVARILR
jgi:glycosyltransferase involved in cell wall biosynthesis